MNIYLDESYNFQKTRGNMFLSISRFAVSDEKGLRRRWRSIRRPHVKSKRRIHATDSEFEGLRQMYADLLKKMFEETHLEEYQRVRIVLDARKHKGGASAENEFRKGIEDWLENRFPYIQCTLQMVPSCVDILVELADFLSNSFYKEYQGGTEYNISGQLSRRLTQIKNPL